MGNENSFISPLAAFSRHCRDSTDELSASATKSDRHAPALKYLTLTDETKEKWGK